MLTLRDLLTRLTSPEFLWVAVWTGLGAFTFVLVGLLLTRWGKTQPVQKCTILSVWFHVLLVVYATSIQVVPQRQGPGNEVVINLGAVDGDPQAKSVSRATPPSGRLPEASRAAIKAPPLPSTSVPRATPPPRQALPKPASPLDLPIPTAVPVRASS